MNLDEFMKSTYVESERFELRPRITCQDGTLLSVQASEFHYSTPRENGSKFYHVEVGFPSIAPPESWMKYFDGAPEQDPTGSVYAYIPIDLVQKFIDNHGGIDTEKTFATTT